MAVIRVSGTRTLTPQGPTTISSPNGLINLDSTLTYAYGSLTVNNTATVLGNIDVRGTWTTVIIKPNDDNVTNPFGFPYNPANMYGTPEQRRAGAVYIGGGMGIEKDLNVGGYIYGRISQANTSLQLVITSTNLDSTFYPVFTDNPDGGGFIYSDVIGNDGGLKYNPFQGKLTVDQVKVAASTPSISTNTGALVVIGGAGIGGDVNIGGDVTSGNLTPNENLALSVGTTSSQWYQGYLENLYTNVIRSTTGNIQIDPAAGLTEVVGDIRVLGNRPIGTAPVVTNVLYVTVDGNDTNDGRAQDSSRACRTIGGAINSPYYQSGTQIRVSPGFYLEDNPLRLKPYTSVMGSDIRTTFVEPINKTQDLFHVESGCYLAFMTFLNGRSGLLEGPYAPEVNRGAYCTAFPPPSVGEDPIDLFHSPYVQNCTNQSGPWLRDGTMFVPNQTVQVPSAVGTGTWAKNTTSIVVNVTTGTIEQGMYINAGQQNPGFFNARTLALANKPFLQEQIIRFINDSVSANTLNTSSIWYNFVYNQEKCKRDVGILVENVAYDAAFGGNEKTVESGLAYYNGVVSLIEGQQLQTTAAINYLSSLTQSVIVNTPCIDLLSGTGTAQIINLTLTGGNISVPSVASSFATITNIIIDGVEVAPEIYRSPGPDAAFVSAEILMQANRSFIQQDTINYINNIIYAGALPYSEVKCRRDTGLIIDSVAFDLLYPTTGTSQSTFAGLQYWSQDNYVAGILDEVTTTTEAISYLKGISSKIIKNITEADDLIPRYQTIVSQVTNLQPATDEEVDVIESKYDVIYEIVSGNKTGWTDRIVPNGNASDIISVYNAYNLLQANKSYLAAEVTAYIDYITSGTGFVYNTSTCQRDVGYMVDAVSFDLVHGGNRQSVQTGLYYYGFSLTTSTIQQQETATIDAFNRLATLISDIVINNPIVPSQNVATQTFTDTTATVTESNLLVTIVSTITNIIDNGPTVAAPFSGIQYTNTVSQNKLNAWKNIYANKNFLIEEVIAYIDQSYNPGLFNYDEAKCYRDVGLIVDSVSQDILLGGNQKSVEAGLAYWSAGYNYVSGQVTTTTMAINHARDIALQIIANSPVTPQTGTILTQVINPYFQYGGDYMPQEAVTRNFGIITNIIENGPYYAPPVYAGGGLFALTGLNGADVKISPRVVSVNTITTGTFLIGLNTATIGFGNNSTLYFGNTLIFPLRDYEVEEQSLELTGSTITWNQRKVDPVGSMGGSLVDGSVISARSPIQSFVYDAFTQVTQGGKGVHIKNNGYAQLVSVFTIFCSVGVQVESGGIASIVNSNANFGNICLLAKGYGNRKFTGTIYNPPFKSYPPDPEDDIYFPDGYWPNGARVQVFLPDIDDRPHISLVMEVEPPEGHINEQGFPGFLNASPSLATLSTGSIVISGIDTTGIAVGNSLYIRDQFGNQTGTNGVFYVATGTVVTDLGYQSVTLNKALTSGGGEVDNPAFFDLYFCGNSYYTVLSSEVALNPKPTGTNILSTASGLLVDQVAAHIDALTYLNTLTTKVISNTTITPVYQNTTTQYKDVLITNGPQAESFINLRFGEMKSIISAANVTAAEAVIPNKLRTKTGTVPLGASSAINLITRNIEFLADEVSYYVAATNPSLNFNFNKCQRDVKIIIQRLLYDLETGGRYNSVMTGLSYWSRNGTHHLVQLGENVRRTDLFPDGSVVNFYQRSYMSASGYVFEYVGAGIDYGALPQRGIADPVQSKETVQLDSGKVFFTSTDQNGDFRIGPGLVISQATGVLSGRTFTKSLFANMTPFILAIEGGG